MNELEATRAKLKCLEMVEGTNLNWWDVVRLAGKECKTPLDFSYPTACYVFALGVVEGKPVWVGDKLFCNDYGNIPQIILTEYVLKNNVGWSWNQPKPATLMVELPIEIVEHGANAMIVSTDIRNAFRKALEQMK